MCDDCETNCNVSVCAFQNYYSEFILDIDQNGLNEVFLMRISGE